MKAAQLAPFAEVLSASQAPLTQAAVLLRIAQTVSLQNFAEHFCERQLTKLRRLAPQCFQEPRVLQRLLKLFTGAAAEEHEHVLIGVRSQGVAKGAKHHLG